MNLASYHTCSHVRITNQQQLTGGDMTAHNLDKELARYESELMALLPEHENKFAIIKGDDAIATYDTFDDALNCSSRDLI